MKKKTVLFILTGLAVLALAGCGTKWEVKGSTTEDMVGEETNGTTDAGNTAGGGTGAEDGKDITDEENRLAEEQDTADGSNGREDAFEGGEVGKTESDVQEDAQLPQQVKWEAFTEDVSDFSISLFRETVEAETENANVLVSPTSVLFAFGMTADGANGGTLSELQDVIWKGMDQTEFDTDMEILQYRMTSSKNVSFHLANSVWVRDDADRLVLKESFEEAAKEYYSSETVKADFDESTVAAINDWVKTNTDGMIPKLLSDIPEDAVMYLINALAFEGEWLVEYEDSQVWEKQLFTNASGQEEYVTMLRSSEGCYLEDDGVTGFLKYYKGGEYAFMALLPKEGTDFTEYVSGMTGDSYRQLLGTLEYTDVEVKLPEFSVDYDTELSAPLKQMGITEAFDAYAADFTRMADFDSDTNLFISKVLHKTHIEVDRSGTKAAAVTAVEVENCVEAIAEEPKQVYLDRPFLYAVIDVETGNPVFIGVQNSCGELE